MFQVRIMGFLKIIFFFLGHVLRCLLVRVHNLAWALRDHITIHKNSTNNCLGYHSNKLGEKYDMQMTLKFLTRYICMILLHTRYYYNITFLLLPPYYYYYSSSYHHDAMNFFIIMNFIISLAFVQLWTQSLQLCIHFQSMIFLFQNVFMFFVFA